MDAVYVNAAGDVGIGTTTPTWDVNIHRASGSSYEHFTTTSTGTTTADGLVVGTEGTGLCYVWNYESGNLILGTNNQTMVVLDSADAVKIGAGYSWSGKLDVYRLGVTTPEVSLSTDAHGGNATFSDEEANTTVLISADGNGTGGLVHVSKDATYYADEGIDLNGSWSGTEQPALRVMGTERSANFFMGNSGTTSVQLPVDAIGGTEILDEPGVARNENTVAIPLTGGVDVLTSRSITVPSAGYVLALGTCAVLAEHTSTVTSTCRIAVSSTTALPIGQNVWFQVPDAAPTGNYYGIVTVHDLFEVAAAATYTYYFLADEGGGDVNTDSAILTLAYFPTAYGTVELTERGGDDDAQGLPLTPTDIAAEQTEARDFHLARIDRELAEIRAEVEAMKAEPGAQAVPAVAPARSAPEDGLEAACDGPVGLGRIAGGQPPSSRPATCPRASTRWLPRGRSRRSEAEPYPERRRTRACVLHMVSSGRDATTSPSASHSLSNPLPPMRTSVTGPAGTFPLMAVPSPDSKCVVSV